MLTVVRSWFVRTLGKAPSYPHVSWILKSLVLTLLLGAALFGPAAAEEDDRLATIDLPEGFVIETFADVPNARQMAWGEKGTLFVGTRREGRVYAVTDEDGDGRGERVREVASGLRMPSGVAFRDGALHVAAVNTILRFDDIEARLDDPPAATVVPYVNGGGIMAPRAPISAPPLGSSRRFVRLRRPRTPHGPHPVAVRCSPAGADRHFPGRLPP